MLQGHIDLIEDGKVAGWIYSSIKSVTGMRLLAFSGSQCIGVGEIGLYREDLQRAGLDDGKLGFEIRYDPTLLTQPRALNLRLENSDFCLLPGDFWKEPPAQRGASLGLYCKAELDRLDWMAAQGWLSQDQYTMAKSLNVMGVYQRAISRLEVANTTLSAVASKLMADCLGILFKKEPEAFSSKLVSERYAPDKGLPAATRSPVSDIIAVFASPFNCLIAEGRNRLDAGDDHEIRTMRYQNSAHQCMILHRDCLEGQLEYFETPPEIIYCTDVKVL
jgi:hypothetical protein